MVPVLNVTDDLTHCGHMGHVIHDFNEACGLAQEFGFAGVNLDFGRDDDDTVARKRDILLQHELQAVAFGLPVRLYSNHSDGEFEASLRTFEQQAAWADRLGCRLVMAWLPPFSNELRFDQYFRLMTARLSRLAATLERFQLKLALEFIGPVDTRVNSRHDFVHTIDGTRALIAASGLFGLAGMKLDVHHWQFSGAGRLDLRHLDREYLLYIELNDGLSGYGMFDMPEFQRELPLATGVTDVAGFMAGLVEKDYRGPIAVEPWNTRLCDMDRRSAISLARKSLAHCLSLAST